MGLLRASRGLPFQRFLASEHGRKILAEKRLLVDTLCDREALMAMPDGSFGRTYADFTAREQISPARPAIAESDLLSPWPI